MNYRNTVHRMQCHPNHERRIVEQTAAEPCKTTFLNEAEFSLAMVYPISQTWRLINDGNEGFERGTIFDELNKPFCGDKCKKGIC